MEKDGAVRKKAEDPGARRSVDTQRSQHSNHHLRLNVVKKAGKVEEKDATDPIGGDTIPSLKVQEGGSIGSREEFPGAKLVGSQKIKAEVEGT